MLVFGRPGFFHLPPKEEATDIYRQRSGPGVADLPALHATLSLRFNKKLLLLA